MLPWPEEVAIRLLTLRRADGWPLEAGLYAPEAGAPARDVGLVLVHGKGENFYSGPSRWVPPRLTPHGYTCLALNMRCHDLGYTRADTPFRGVETEECLMDGGAWERLTEGKQDLAAAVAYEHHLHLDGRGYPTLHYPRQAHQASRLVHVCDVYDALRTKRPYRDAWTSAEALDYIEKRAGAEFDPDAVKPFMEMMRQWDQRIAPVDPDA